MLGIFDHVHMTRNGGNLSFIGEFFGFDLVAHRHDGTSRRPDEFNTSVRQSLTEIGILGEEAIARMNSFRTGILTSLNDLVTQQIGFCCRRWAEMNSFIGHLHVQSVLIRVGIDSDGFNAHALS